MWRALASAASSTRSRHEWLTMRAAMRSCRSSSSGVAGNTAVVSVVGAKWVGAGARLYAHTTAVATPIPMHHNVSGGTRQRIWGYVSGGTRQRIWGYTCLLPCATLDFHAVRAKSPGHTIWRGIGSWVHIPRSGPHVSTRG
jgi:hypothetical protein